jgi:hypothetical protein
MTPKCKKRAVGEFSMGRVRQCTSALIDSHKRLQIEYNNRPIRDANSKNKFMQFTF